MKKLEEKYGIDHLGIINLSLKGITFISLLLSLFLPVIVIDYQSTNPHQEITLTGLGYNYSNISPDFFSISTSTSMPIFAILIYVTFSIGLAILRKEEASKLIGLLAYIPYIMFYLHVYFVTEALRLFIPVISTPENIVVYFNGVAYYLIIIGTITFSLSFFFGKKISKNFNDKILN